MLSDQIFPESVLEALKNYFKNPKASSCSDPYLYQVLRQFDSPNEKIALDKITTGELFEFNQRKFQKLEKRRTRIVCLEQKTGRKYLIAAVAEVQPIKN